MGSSIGVIVFLALVIGPWILKGIAAASNDRAEEEKSRKRRSQREGTDYDELARRRRAELQQLAAQRDQQRNAPSGHIVMDQPDPASLTMAQRIELARQRAGQKQHGGHVDPHAQAFESMEAQHAQTQREQQIRQQRANQQKQAQQQQAQRKAKAQQRAQVEQARRQQQQQKQAQQIAAAKSHRKKRAASGTSAKQTQEAVQKPSSAAKRSRVRSATQGSSSSTSNLFAPIDLKKLDARSLRQAFVMKELIDKPLALRTDQDAI